MDKNGDLMAVDPESPAASFKDSLEEQPTAPRRNSIEDEDTTRPRKRLAAMGLITPQSDSPGTEKVDELDESLVHAAPTQVSSLRVHSPHEGDLIERSPELPEPRDERGGTTEDHGPRCPPSPSATLSKITVNLRPTRVAAGNKAHRLNGHDEAASDDGDKDDLGTASCQTSSETPISLESASTQEEYSFSRQSEAEIESFKDSSDDSTSPERAPAARQSTVETAEDVQIIKDGLDQAAVIIFSDPDPRACMVRLEQFLTDYLNRNHSLEVTDVVPKLSLWMKVYRVFEALLKRSELFHREFFQPREGGGGIRSMQMLFQLLHRLTAYLLRIDAELLNHPERSPETLALTRNYMQISLSFWFGNEPLHIMIRDTYKRDLADEMTIDVTETTLKFGGLKSLKDYIRGLNSRLQSHPKFLSYYWLPLSMAYHWTSRIFKNEEAFANRMEPTEYESLFALLIDTMLDIFVGTQAALKKALESNPQTVNIREFEHLVDMLAATVKLINGHRAEEGLRMISQTSNPKFRELSPEEQEYYAEALFKLPFQFSMIRCSRMEFRIMGMNKLSNSLLDLWNTLHGNGGGTASPTLRYMAEDICESGLMEYLMGPESHPELIRMATQHIYAFLVVNQALTPAIRETIWRPLIENKDPRIVQAVIQMITETLRQLDYHIQLDFCERATRIPLTCYDASVMEFVCTLLNQTSKRFYEDSRMDSKLLHARLHPAPYGLITGILRHASNALENSESLRSVALTLLERMGAELGNIAQYGPEAPVRERIYHECVSDIKEQNSAATGSIVVLKSFLQGRQGLDHTSFGVVEDVEILTRQLGLADALVAEISAFIEANRGQTSPVRDRKLYARVELLYWMLFRAPSCMASPMIDRLCLYLIGDKSLGNWERDETLRIFAQLVITGKRSPFVDHVFRQVLPGLNPLYISPSQLEFCKKWIESNNGLSHPYGDVEEEASVEGIEQIWQIVLRVPDNGLALEAICFLMKLYLESPIIMNKKNDTINATHRKVIGRCIKQLTSSAVYTKGDTPDGSSQQMAVDMPEADTRGKQLEFIRSIGFLSEILKCSRMKPRNLSFLNGESNHVIGEPITIKLMWHNSKFRSPTTPLNMGDLSKAKELHDRISQIIGSPNYRAILNGRELNIPGEPDKALRDFGFSEVSSLMVMKKPEGSQDDDSNHPTQNLNPIEAEVLKHFDELYELLSLPEPQGQLIWDILKQFPLQPRVQHDLLSPDLQQEFVPSGYPFRSFYILYGVRSCLEDPKLRGDAKEKFVCRAIEGLVQALINRAFSLSGSTNLQFSLYNDAITTLLKLIQVSASKKLPESILGNEQDCIERLIDIWESSLQPKLVDFEASGVLAVNTFTVIMESISYHQKIWAAFVQNQKTVDLVSCMLLQDSRSHVRYGAARVIACAFNSISADFVDIAGFFWPVLVKLLPRAQKWDQQASDLFGIAEHLFNCLGPTDVDPESLHEYFIAWSDKLITHRSNEIMGRPREDFVVIGYSQLLCTWLKNYGTGGLCTDIESRMECIFGNLLFTPINEPNEEDKLLYERIPCLGPQTRKELYQLLLTLAEHSPSTNDKMIELLSGLFPQDSSFIGEGAWNVDRMRWPISAAGRVGLRNLSNTCYLNSLLTQLYMNIHFRSFILSLPIDNPESQSLLYAMKVLFAHMQNGLLKSADTRQLTHAIKDYDNNAIDITVQMDVDEFFNLLFDRLESQIESIEHKTIFKGFYGGKLVQQVKSKECPHISEREEPFSAIQCDIKGKANLQESLKAYVEGEIMEGDNKYSCTSCNRHVDAVKRACLKEVPDHLIFHLKRFEFDLNTMVRSKINDKFSFPEEIDMRPYTIQYLSNPESSSSPDLYQLTGVLVHNGTAESGHYYSYIKDRQISSENAPVWFDFNDADVSTFDPSTISAMCYGGTELLGPNKELSQPINFPKTYSAYMLFYERVKPLTLRLTVLNSRMRIPVPKDLEMDIFHENERMIRKFCLFDDIHLRFTHAILRAAHKPKAQDENKQTTALAKKALCLALKTYEQIGSRLKESPESEELISKIQDILAISRCVDCCKTFLDWACGQTDSLRLLLLRSTNPRVRERFSNLIWQALEQIQLSGDNYRSPAQDNEFDDSPGYLNVVINSLLSLWSVLPIVFRNWDEYLKLLGDIADLGQAEVRHLLEAGVLRRALILFMPEYLSLDREAKIQHSNLLRMADRTKRPSYWNLLILISKLLLACDLAARPCDAEDDRPSDEPKLPLTLTEYQLFWLKVVKDGQCVNVFIYKQTELNSNISYTQLFVKMILDLEPCPWLQEPISNVRNALLIGIAMDPADEAGPFLKGLLAYCLCSRDSQEVKNIIYQVADEVKTINQHGGAEHLDFFRTLWKTQYPHKMKPNFLSLRLVETVHLWAPPLLVYCEPAIRIGTEHLVLEELVQKRSSGTEKTREKYENAVMKLADACFDFAENKFLKDKNISAGADEKSFDSLIHVLELCPKGDEEWPDYYERIESLKMALNRLVEDIEFGSEDWAASDMGSESNQELVDDDSV